VAWWLQVRASWLQVPAQAWAELFPVVALQERSVLARSVR